MNLSIFLAILFFSTSEAHLRAHKHKQHTHLRIRSYEKIEKNSKVQVSNSENRIEDGTERILHNPLTSSSSSFDYKKVVTSSSSDETKQESDLKKMSGLGVNCSKYNGDNTTEQKKRNKSSKYKGDDPLTGDEEDCGGADAATVALREIKEPEVEEEDIKMTKQVYSNDFSKNCEDPFSQGCGPSN